MQVLSSGTLFSIAKSAHEARGARACAVARLASGCAAVCARNCLGIVGAVKRARKRYIAIRVHARVTCGAVAALS